MSRRNATWLKCGSIDEASGMVIPILATDEPFPIKRKARSYLVAQL